MKLPLIVLLVTASLAACAPAQEEDDATEAASAVIQQDLHAAAVSAVIAKISAGRSREPIAPFYEDGDRVEACWRNPAGRKLSDVKKAFYCSYPLEFRLCNTVVLLTVDASDVAGRYRGYLRCQEKVDRVIPGLFRYDAKVNALYKRLYLEDAPLDAEDAAAVVDANKPELSSRSFPKVLRSVADGLAREAVTLGVSFAEQDLERRAAAVP